MPSLALSQSHLPYQGILARSEIILNRFQVQFDGFTNILHSIIDRISFTDASGQSRRVNCVSPFIAWFKHDSQFDT